MFQLPIAAQTPLSILLKAVMVSSFIKFRYDKQTQLVTALRRLAEVTRNSITAAETHRPVSIPSDASVGTEGTTGPCWPIPEVSHCLRYWLSSFTWELEPKRTDTKT